MSMITQRLSEVLAEQVSRRRFMRRATGAALAAVAALSGFSSPVSARIAGCCNLRYDVNCPDLSCVDYYWVCCDGAFAWTCYECYTHECSLAVWQNCQCSWSPSAAPMDC